MGVGNICDAEDDIKRSMVGAELRRQRDHKTQKHVVEINICSSVILQGSTCMKFNVMQHEKVFTVGYIDSMTLMYMHIIRRHTLMSSDITYSVFKKHSAM